MATSFKGVITLFAVLCYLSTVYDHRERIMPRMNSAEIIHSHTLSTFTDAPLGHLKILFILVLDSSSKIPNGFLEGKLRDMGNFDECVAVSVKENWGSFRGQYCLATIHFSSSEFNITPRKDDHGEVYSSVSACVPSTCTPEDVKGFFKTLMPSRTITVDPNGCQTSLPQPYTALDYATIGVFVCFAVLCVFSTSYDLLWKNTANRKKILTAFSWYTNGKALLTTKVSKESLTVLQGIRFLSMAWIVYGHVCGMLPQESFVNGLDLFIKLRGWEYIPAYGAVFAVDTFFLLSGTLVSYLTLTELKKGVKFNVLIFYMHRYFRMTPLVAIVLLVQSSIFRHFSSGPLWKMYSVPTQERCREHWWAPLLYIQNFFRAKESCLGVLWYLCVDFQLYVLSPLLLIPLSKWPKFGFAMLQVLTVIMAAVGYVINWVKEVPATIVRTNLADITLEYGYPHMRCTPWLIGISLGVVLLHTKGWRNEQQTSTHSKWRLFFSLSACWISIAVMLVAPVACFYPFQQVTYEFNPVDSALFFSLGRPIWALGLSLLIFICVSGYGGVVNLFLSCSVLRPLARLTFAMYLIHVPVINLVFYSIRTEVYVDQFNQIMRLISILVVTGFLSVVASLMFESPVIALIKILLSSSHNRQRAEVVQQRRTDINVIGMNNGPAPRILHSPAYELNKIVNCR